MFAACHRTGNLHDVGTRRPSWRTWSGAFTGAHPQPHTCTPQAFGLAGAHAAARTMHLACYACESLARQPMRQPLREFIPTPPVVPVDHAQEPFLTQINLSEGNTRPFAQPLRHNEGAIPFSRAPVITPADRPCAGAPSCRILRTRAIASRSRTSSS
jgi:hypothetical protein